MTTNTMVVSDYRFLARLLSLMPWRKSENYSIELVRRTNISARVEGNVIKGQPEEQDHEPLVPNVLTINNPLSTFF